MYSPAKFRVMSRSGTFSQEASEAAQAFVETQLAEQKASHLADAMSAINQQKTVMAADKEQALQDQLVQLEQLAIQKMDQQKHDFIKICNIYFT